jgi:hypothetical protein
MEFHTIRRLHRLSLWMLGVTALLILAGLISHGRTWVVHSSPISESSLYFSPVGMGWIRVHDETGTAFPFYSARGRNKNIVNDSGRTLAMSGGRLGCYYSTEYSLVAGGKIRVVAWRLTYIPQVMLAMILPIARLVGRTRRFWPGVGVWEYDRRKSRGIQRLCNAVTVISLLIFAVTMALWGIAFFVRGALPQIQFMAEREIWFERGSITLMSVVQEDETVTELLKQQNPGEKGPWFRATATWRMPYYAVALAALLLPLTRGSIARLRTRKKVRRLALGHCPQCGYDLRMSEDRCPECGAAFARKTVITLSN